MHVQTDFDSFQLDTRLTRAVREAGILTPTTVQRAALPPLIEGRDLAMQAVSGTGRTLAWCLPLVHRLLAEGPDSRALVLVSENEAALRVEREIRRLIQRLDLDVLMPVSGVERSGASYEMFERGDASPHILVGRPASVRHYVEGTGFPLEQTRLFVANLVDELNADDRRALEELAGRMQPECQRVVVAEEADLVARAIEDELVRSPAMVIGTSASSELERASGEEVPADEEEEEEEPVSTGEHRPRPRYRASRTRPTRSVPSAERPERWPIAHIGVTVPGPVSAEELGRVARVEASGHTLVLVGDEDAARGVAEQIRTLLPRVPVRVLAEGDEIPDEEATAVTVAPLSARERKDLTANVLILARFPPRSEDYLAFIPLLRCEEGDRLITMVTPRDVSTQYELRLATGIRLMERRPPTDAEIRSSDEADELGPLRDRAAEANDRDVALLARLRTLDEGERILAVALRRLLEETVRGRAHPGAGGSRRGRGDDRRRRKAEPRRSKERGRGPGEVSGAGGEPEELLRHAEPELPERGAGRRGGVPMVEVEMSCGREAGVERDYIAQWLQSRLAMRVSELGPIEVGDASTRITVPEERVEEAVRMLAELTFGECRPEVKIRSGAERGRS
jgi:ATP-dependent RNA helicase DeaD